MEKQNLKGFVAIFLLYIKSLSDLDALGSGLVSVVAVWTATQDLHTCVDCVHVCAHVREAHLTFHLC